MRRGSSDSKREKMCKNNCNITQQSNRRPKVRERTSGRRIKEGFMVAVVVVVFMH